MNTQNQDENTSLLASFLHFIIHPSYQIRLIQKKTRAKFWDVFKLWSFAILIAMVLGIVITVLLNLAGYDEKNHLLTQFILERKIFLLFLFAAFWAPLAEEMTFRLGLRYSPYKLGFSLVFLLMLVCDYLFSRVFKLLPPWVFDLTSWRGLVFYFSFILIVGFLLSSVLKKFVKQSRAEKFYARNFQWIYYGSSLIFASLHIFNYTKLSQIWFLIPLLVTPQFFLGLVLGFVRIRYGFSWAVLNHFIHNALSLLPLLILGFLSEDLRNVLLHQNALEMKSIGAHDSVILMLGGFAFSLISLLVLVALIFLFSEYYHQKKRRLA
ncbi:MAG: CPBP family glutamic-type intramembrane protease [Patescibacteria group bacterium]|nr:CPBP family glutamic-type intramembrane protease [Patescibacteria group bacterium]